MSVRGKVRFLCKRHTCLEDMDFTELLKETNAGKEKNELQDNGKE